MVSKAISFTYMRDMIRIVKIRKTELQNLI